MITIKKLIESDHNTGFWQNWGNDYDIYYERDVQNRIVSRYEIGLATNDTWYGFTGGSDTPDFTRNANWDITEKYLELAGGVILTIRPQATGNAQKAYSLPNLHGDIFATTNAAGVQTGTFQYDPFGQTVGTVQPNNTTASTSYGWVGQHEKKSETDLALKPIQMGERVYLPSIGRFASVDPVEGGTANNYVYPPDPVGDFDLSGQFGMKDFANVASIGSMIPGPIGMASAAVSAAAYAKAGDRRQAVIMASSIALAGVGAGAAVSGAKIFQAVKGAGGVKPAINTGLNKMAAKAWSGGTVAMEKHFKKHGSTLGYKTAWGYTAGALKVRALAVQSHKLRSGGTAFRSSNYTKVVLTYNETY